MDSIKDLLEISLSAQYEYLLARIASKKDIRNFENASQYILSCIVNLTDYDDTIVTNVLDLEEFDNKLSRNCLSLYLETKNNLMARFVHGYTNETVVEKL